MEIKEFADLYSKTDASLPAYRRIKSMLIEHISAGSLPAGSLVPSENELVTTLGVSRMTVNRAMRELTAGGILTRTRGVGTFVAEPKVPGALLEVRNIADEIKQRGRVHSTRVVHLRTVTDQDVATFPQEIGSPAFYSCIVHLEDGVPFQLEERFVSPALAPDYLTQNFESLTPNDYLTQVAPITHGKHSVEAVLGSEQECSLLNINQDLPCLRVTRYTYSASGLVSIARLLHPGSKIRLEGDLQQ